MGGSPTTAGPPAAIDPLARVTAVCDALADAGNPLTVRLLRQQARSLTIAIVLHLLLVCGVVATVVAGTIAPELLTGSRMSLLRSELLFLLVVTIWTAVSWIVQPVMFIATVRQEREEATWDLLDLTGLPPLRILLGLIAAAAIQQFLLLAMMAPFLVMAWMLNGIDPLAILLAILVIPLNGLVTVCVGIKATVAGKRGGLAGRPGRAAIGASLAWLLVMYLLWMITVGRGFFPGFPSLRALNDGVVLTILLLSNLALHIGAAALVDAAMRLTHPAANRSTAPRMLALAFVANLVLVLLGFALSGVIDWLLALAWAAVGIAVWNAFASIDGIAEPYEHTRRQADWCARHRGLWRLFAPGAAAARQFHLALALPALLAGAATWVAGHGDHDGTGSVGAVAVGAVAYGLIILMLGDAAARAGDRNVSQPLRHRRMVWGIIILGTLAGGFLTAVTRTSLLAALSPVFGLFPFAMAGSGARWAEDALGPVILVCMGALFALLVMIDQARHRPGKRPVRGEAT